MGSAATTRLPVRVGGQGDGTTASDLDLLVVRSDRRSDAIDEDWDQQVFDRGERIFAATGNRAAWLVVTPADLERAVKAEEPIVDEWRRDGVHLAGRRLGTLIREAA